MEPFVAIDQTEKKVAVLLFPPLTVSISIKSAWIDDGIAKSALRAKPLSKQIIKKAKRSPELINTTEKNTPEA